MDAAMKRIGLMLPMVISIDYGEIGDYPDPIQNVGRASQWEHTASESRLFS